MDVVIKKPVEVSEHEMEQIVLLIIQGNQIQGDVDTIKQRLANSVYIGFIIEEGQIVSTATLKSPVESYRAKVFVSAKAEAYKPIYKYELGYIVTAKKHEGRKLCQDLLTAFYQIIASKKIFATTRKESIKHILGKYGFINIGEKFNGDLFLLVN
ncbi:hypothetical protein [Flavobacterium sp.]|uniref:hypothetical protein n=1 Tax=Flavobacterium sp. TaxID=239 RepID=UPI004033D1C2